MNRSRKYVWVGIAVLVSLCLLVNGVTASGESGSRSFERLYINELSGSYYSGSSATSALEPLNGIGMKDIETLDEIAYASFTEQTIGTFVIPDGAGSTDFVIRDGANNLMGTGTISYWKLPGDYAKVSLHFDTWNILGKSGDHHLKLIFDASKINGLKLFNQPKKKLYFGASTPNCLVAIGVWQSPFVYVSPSTFKISSYSETHDMWKNVYSWNLTDELVGNYNITIIKTTAEAGASSSRWELWTENGMWINESSLNTNDITDETIVGRELYFWCINSYGDEFYDTAAGGGRVDIQGHVYNVINGSKINNATVTFTQTGSDWDATTDAEGLYHIYDLEPEYDVSVSVTKDSYMDFPYSFYLPEVGLYTIDLYMLPISPLPSHTGHGILGIVRTLPYYQTVGINQLVSIENATWSNTTNTNNMGFYIFDELEVGDYWINVSKDAYRDNNHSVTVSATGDEVVTIDNCNATTNWSSDNSLTLNTTDKQEGTGSLQSSGSNTLDFNKSAPSAIDASNVTKSNGYMTFWYKVNDTTRITDYLVFTVGSNGDNSTHKISWSVYKSNFVNDTWKEIWLKFSDGTETGTLNMSNVNWLEVKAAKSDSVLSKIDDIRFYDFSYEIHNVDLDPILALGVIAKTLDENIIDSFSATLDGATKNTTTGQELVFSDLSYGMKELTVTSEGYIPYQRSVYLDSNTNITAYLTKETEGGAGVYYPPPHLVEFRLQNIYGNPISDISVTAQGYETTMGSWNWLYSIFGYKNETQIHNTTMSGTTDTMGHLSFMMVETIKYKMDFVKESEGINKTMYFYPKESQYLIVLTPTIQPDMIDYVNWNLSVEAIDSSHSSLNFTYNDNMSKTSQICFFVKDENRTEIYSTCSFVDNSSVDTGHTVAKSSGASYFWGFNATHDTFGGIKGTKAITFKSRLIDLQLENENYYTWISISLLVMITSLFSAVTSKFGYVVIPFMAGFFVYIGFLEIPITLITVIIILGILLYMGRRERESGL